MITTTVVHPLTNWLTRILDETEADNTPLQRPRRVGNLRDILAPEMAYVLADIPAKRRVITRHSPYYGKAPEPRCAGCQRGVLWPCPEIRDVISVFSARAGYRKEWGPQDV